MSDPTPRPWRRRLRRATLVSGAGLVVTIALLAASVEHDPPPATPILERREDAGAGYELNFVQLWVTTPGDPERHKVQILEYRSTQPGRRPAVIVTPMFGGRQPIARRLGPALARRGIHAAVVLRAERYLVGDAPPERLERVLRTAVIDRRRTLDWLAGQPHVDPQRFGALGVSLGGLGTALLCATDSRIKAGVLVLAGGGLETLIPSSRERRALEFVAAWKARGVDASALQAKIKAAVPSDPLALAGSLDPARLLFVTARRDEDVPFANQQLLWKAAGRPERYSLPTGHASSAIYAPWLAPLCLDWLEAKLSD
ncbi:MAG: hypothetical protein JKY65_09010 [Planctomycetes bacterium]|nr:hypothetical protein [Planctomycetota bacterium]